MGNILNRVKGAFRALREEITARGGLFEASAQAFAHIYGNDPSKSIGAALTGFGAVTAASAIMGVLPLGVAVNALIGCAAVGAGVGMVRRRTQALKPG